MPMQVPRVMVVLVAVSLNIALLPATSGLLAQTERLQLDWEKNYLTISGAQVPGQTIRIHYLEAYCRANSTHTDWVQHTVIGHETELVARGTDGTSLHLRCHVNDGLVVDHHISSSHDEIDFRIEAHNPTNRISEAHWAQPCIRLDKFTAADQQGYLAKSFIFVDGELTRMPFDPWATHARYTPGQVWRPQEVPASDVNPRPLSSIHPSHGLIGCYSADEETIFAVAFTPYQELFQGVAVCLHSDFRLGGVKPKATHTIRGKMYIIPADPEGLLARYESDFPSAQSR